MTGALGGWSNAPLVYVLAEVRTERLADVSTYQPRFAGRLRDDGYPLQRAMQTAKLVASRGQVAFEADQDTAWEFATPDNRTAVILRANGLVLHATAYKNETEFLNRLSRVMSVFADEIPAVYVNRLGLRYIDFILPSEAEELSAYIDKRLDPDLGLAKGSGGVTSTSLAIYPMKDKKRLSVRYTRGQGKPALPPDLGILALDPSPLMNPSGIDDNRSSGVLDTDCSLVYSPVERLDASRVKEHFALIYTDLFQAFMTAITDHARRVWGAK